MAGFISLTIISKVPMHYSLFYQGNESVHDLPYDLDRPFLGDNCILLDVFFEVAVAEFLDDVVIVGALHDLVDGDDVLGLDLLQDLYLLQQRVLEVLVGVDWVSKEVLRRLASTLMAQMRFVCSCSPLNTSPYEPRPMHSFRWIMYLLIFLNDIWFKIIYIIQEPPCQPAKAMALVAFCRAGAFRFY